MSAIATGLSLEANTGVIYGTPNYSGRLVLSVQASDSAASPQTATKLVAITTYSPMAKMSEAMLPELQQFQSMPSGPVIISGGVPPLKPLVTQGALPPGVHFDSQSRILAGAPLEQGTFQGTLTVEDSYSSPEVVSVSFNLVVQSPPVSIAASLPGHLVINMPFQGQVVAVGGKPPYTFSLISGTLPAGLSLDPGGILSGTPVQQGNFSFMVRVVDSQAPRISADRNFTVDISPARQRNDTIATATRIGGNITASISPYIDPPNGPPFPGDIDYYRLRALGGTTVHVETRGERLNSGNPLDTVLELVDGNNQRLNTCGSPAFNSPCLNDDLSSSPHVQDSVLDFKVPGTSSDARVFYARVLDWRGDARPDMTYFLEVSNLLQPLSSTSPITLATTVGNHFVYTLNSSGGLAPVTWAVASGSLPPGLGISSQLLQGVPTAKGDYSFSLLAQDAGNPPDAASVTVNMQVVDPVVITSSPTLPDACLNQIYSFTPTTIGGVSPLNWKFSGTFPVPFANLSHTFSGTPTQLGTFSGLLTVTDSANSGQYQPVSLTVKQCP